MTVQTKMPATSEVMIPEGAPFSPEQRSWLNGFFAGLLSLDAAAGATALNGAMPDAAAKALGSEDGGAPWHDAAMPIAERMTLAEDKPLPRKLFAAMAQQDCGECGYLCETYSQAIAEGK
jgi:sulfite reductase (NADPH) flavoprotein alpha-component